MDRAILELPNICHLCLISKPNMLKLQSLERPYFKKLTTIFESITSTPFEVSEAHVQQLCQDCESNLHLISKFRDDYLRANNWWKAYLENFLRMNEDSIEFEEVKLIPALESLEHIVEPLKRDADDILPMTNETTKSIDIIDQIKAEVDTGNAKQPSFVQYVDPLTLPHDQGKTNIKLIAESTNNTNSSSHIISEDTTDTKLQIINLKKLMGSTKANPNNHIDSDAITIKPQTIVKRRKKKTTTYCCDICLTKRKLEVNLYAKRALQAHMKTHVNVCKTCTDCFFSRSELEYHRTMCFPIKWNACDWCDIKITSQFREHALEHHPDAVWPECEKCGAKFPRKRYLITHWRNHMREKTFKCTYCEKAFTKREYLRHHERVHTQELPYVCELCAKAFNQVTSLKMHLKSHANNTVRRKHIFKEGILPPHIFCTLCTYATYHIDTLYAHICTKHGKAAFKEANRLKGLYCGECKCFFEDRESRREHIKEHLQFKCDFCTRRFKDLAGVERHMQTHSQTKRPFVCDICEASFACSANLRRHHRFIHDKEYLFKCDQCPKSYLENWQLSKHKRLEHLNMRPILKCEHCSKVFRSKPGLGSHMKAYHKSNDPV